MSARQMYSPNLGVALRSFWSHRNLLWQLTKREVVGRYRGSIMGTLWSFFNPVLMLAVYTLVFSGVFKAKWGVGGSESRAEFAIILFAGMVVYGLFSDCVSRAPLLILNNVNYVKKVIFPLEILPLVSFFAALFHMAISFSVLLLFYAGINHSLHWTILFMPLLLVPLALLTVGAAWFLSSVGVYLRDVGQTIGMALTILMFVSPVFYSVSALPAKFQFFMMLNPLTFIIEQTRDVVIWGKLPNFTGLAIYTAAAAAVAFAGFAWFQKTRRWFADVL